MRRAALVLLLAFGGCEAPEDEFYGKVFLCNVKNGEAQCGTDRAGKPMVCYPGHLLGGSDFCTEACDPSEPPTDPRFACIDAMASSQEGARVQVCVPGVTGSCPSGLACYRTDLIADTGLCLTTKVCSDNGGCPGGNISCSSVLVEGLGGASIGLQSDNLHCVQSTCSKSDCPSDQDCLFDFFASGDVLPDICVPKCDRGRCPPNFSCAKKPGSAPGTADVCVPGVAGTTCNKSEDCIVGNCLPTGAGFSVCSFPCGADREFCRFLDQATDIFVCAEGIPGQPICVNNRPFAGGNCKDTKMDCLASQECRFYSATSRVPMHADCRTPCGPDRHCDARGGLPFVCVGEMEQGGCHPTEFGLPCRAKEDCNEDLECLEAGPDDRSLHNYSPKLCTATCTSDADCVGIRLIGKRGFCDDAGICRRRGHVPDPCSRNEHCYSERCAEGHCRE